MRAEWGQKGGRKGAEWGQNGGRMGGIYKELNREKSKQNSFSPIPLYT